MNALGTTKQSDFDPNGRFEDLALLGRGSRGDTWRAKDVVTGRDVVLKVRHRTLESETFSQREAQEFARIQHPNLQRLASWNHERDYLVLQYEFVPGRSLRETLRADGPLAPHAARAVLRDVLMALGALHFQNIAHRDVSPENIILADDRAVLIDFDAAGFLDQRSPIGSSTIVGDFAGKFLYMSPEGLAGAPQNNSTDIWALGAVFYEMIVGAPLRRETTVSAILSESLREPELSGIPKSERKLASRMLALDIADRASVEEILAILDQDTPDASAISASHKAIKPVPARSRSPVLQISLGVCAAVLIAGFALVWTGAWEKTDLELNGEVSLAIGLLLGGVILCAFGYFLLRRQLKQTSDSDLTENLKTLIGFDGAEGRKALMRTVIGNLDPEIPRGGIVPVQIAALAQEYVEAKDSSERLEALKVLIDVHHKASVTHRSIWRSPERLTQRALSLTSLSGGLVAAIEGFSRLLG